MWLYDPDGSIVIKATLPAEVGALFIKAMEAAVKAAPPTKTQAEKVVSAGTSSLLKVSPETVDRLAHRRADALARIAESYLKHGEEELAAPERQQIVVHVDVQTLKNSTAGRCELEDGPSLAAETVRRLACDASLVTVIENEDGEPLSVGRKTRAISPALRRALNARDRGCRFPGCPNTRYVDAHHIRHWVHGGETKPSNLVSLCRFHHRQVHEGRVTIDVLDDGHCAFASPAGRVSRVSRPSTLCRSRAGGRSSLATSGGVSRSTREPPPRAGWGSRWTTTPRLTICFSGKSVLLAFPRKLRLEVSPIRGHRRRTGTV